MNHDLIVLSPRRRPYRNMTNDELASVRAGALVSSSIWDAVEANAEWALRRLFARKLPTFVTHGVEI